MAPKKKGLAELRKAIDAVDRRMVGLLAERARLAEQVGRAKADGSRGILDPAREKQVLDAACEANPGPLRDASLQAIFREIISACRDLQRPTSVAFFGPAGTFTHEAAIAQFGSSAALEPCDSIPEVFAAVQAGRATYGVVPVENTTEGAVTPTLDALAETTAQILAERTLRIDHCLMAREADPRKIRRIASHPQPLAQCRRYLGEHFPGVELLPTASTAAAARLAATQKGTAAIGSHVAMRLHGLELVERSIQDNAANTTRFLVIGPQQATRATGRDRTSVVVTVKDEVGVLERVIRCFSRNRVNLSMIESRPLAGRSWEYRFFVDVSGHAESEPVARALRALSRVAISVHVLGSYPVGT